ncbi:DNA/RNA polymerase [Roridomyces roridus]|uniref:DNA polymerase eta n=1 Tax=Roridomyces roridus TaxID=1738132 RepID=A0AAD7CJS7_9AGAR|nr:DNA/RNA polymerase [Roridomyces roridus]
MSTAPRSRSSLWKGKEKAESNDFDDLDPVITYRTLLAQNLGALDPLRVIALCDSDAFYAACEMIRLNIPTKPLVVLQWQALIAVNYPARKFGITRMMKIQDAMKLCPELVVVHVATYQEGDKEPQYRENPDSRTHKVSLDLYRRESVKMLQLYKDGLPEGTEIEKASIDEAFMDLTKPIRQILLERYPYLSQVPDDAPMGLDTPLPPPPPVAWEHLGTLVPIDPSKDPSEEENVPSTWHDVALSIAAEAMEKARQKINAELGYTTSAGIARNKFLAKLCASYRKPMGQSILRNAAIPNYLKPMEFQKIRFLGGKLGESLANEFDVSTVGDLLSISLDDMQRRFGEESIWVYDILRGIDHTEVQAKQAVNKSMLASKNLPDGVFKLEEGFPWIRVLAAELALRLNEAREVTPNLWPKTIVMHVRNVKAQPTSRSKQAPWPFVKEVTVDVVAAAGNKLWKELIGTDVQTPMKVIGMSLAFTGIEGVETGLKSIDTFFKSGVKRPLDSVEDADTENVPEPLGAGSGQRNISKDPTTFICSRCGQRLTLPRSATRTEEERRAQMQKIQDEHEDFHVALEISKEVSFAERGRKPESKGKVRGEEKPKKKRRKESPKGIAKFFNKLS